MRNTSWEPVHSWYDASLGNSGDYIHKTIVIPKTFSLLALKQGDTLCDFGCGQGIFARALPSNILYTGIDISSSLIQSAIKRDGNKHHKYITGDITKPMTTNLHKYSHIVSILSIDNIEHPESVFQNAASLLLKNGVFVFVINHPCFRIPRQSGWGIDEKNKMQYRRINRYMSPLSIPITMHPGAYSSPITWTFHYPLSSYVHFLKQSGFLIETIEEWVSEKTSVGKAASMENRARNEIPLFLAIRAILSSSSNKD